MEKNYFYEKKKKLIYGHVKSMKLSLVQPPLDAFFIKQIQARHLLAILLH